MKIMNWNFELIMDGIASMEAAIEFIKGYTALVNKNATTIYIVNLGTGEIKKVMICGDKIKITDRNW